MEKQFIEFLSKVLQWFGHLAWLGLVPMALTRIITLLVLKKRRVRHAYW